MSSDKDEAQGGDTLRRLAELEAAYMEEKQRADSYLNQLKYAQADIENLRRQMQRRVDEELERWRAHLLLQLIPILEELDLAIESASKANGSQLLRGVEMIRRKLGKILEREGVSPIDALGRPFDPNLHEAVMEVEAPEGDDGIVVEEVRKGYLFMGRVLRPSMVKVARNPGSKKAMEVSG
jgi:molecular chaperone GrpE